MSQTTAMSSVSELKAELLVRLRRREPEALAAIVQDNAKPLCRAARGLGFREEEAEDLVQDVFATFLEALDRFEGRSQVRTWLFGILHHKVMERRRDQYRDQQNDPIDEVFESRFDTHGNWMRPPADLKTLPATQREVFVLREIVECETTEICKILGISVTNLSALLHRARNRLRECIEARGWRRAG